MNISTTRTNSTNFCSKDLNNKNKCYKLLQWRFLQQKTNSVNFLQSATTKHPCLKLETPKLPVHDHESSEDWFSLWLNHACHQWQLWYWKSKFYVLSKIFFNLVWFLPTLHYTVKVVHKLVCVCPSLSLLRKVLVVVSSGQKHVMTFQ